MTGWISRSESYKCRSSPRNTMSENCQFLSVSTTEHCLTQKTCPVVVYIHGGAMCYDYKIMFNETVLYENFGSKNIVFGILSNFTVQGLETPANLFLFDWSPNSTLLSNYHDINVNSKTLSKQSFGWENERIEYSFNGLDWKITENRWKLMNWRKKPTTVISAVLTLVLARVI